MSSTRSDRELLLAWGRGELEAGHELFERHFDALHRFFRTKAEAAVDDLMQQTLLACLEGRERFRHEASFRTYMFQIARHQLYAYYRARDRNRSLDFELLTATDLGDTPSKVMIRQEDAKLLLEALRRIPLAAQIVLELWFWEELSGPEIAQVLAIPEPTVRSRLRRALERLRSELAQLEGSKPASGKTDDDLQRWARGLRAAVDGPG